MIPNADFDCSLLNPVDGNSATYPDRADVVSACEGIKLFFKPIEEKR